VTAHPLDSRNSNTSRERDFCVRHHCVPTKVKFTIQPAMKAQRYSSTLSLISALDGGGGVVNTTPRPLYSRERGPVPIVEEAAWVPGRI
jgi:hypothetical protein